uniref:Protein kinase domain-containing protein n=1 Tax=Macrostomum lignano TaxID=282301 RepID=A0A1I8FIN4_9PLAT
SGAAARGRSGGRLGRPPAHPQSPTKKTRGPWDRACVNRGGPSRPEAIETRAIETRAIETRAIRDQSHRDWGRPWNPGPLGRLNFILYCSGPLGCSPGDARFRNLPTTAGVLLSTASAGGPHVDARVRGTRVGGLVVVGDLQTRPNRSDQVRPSTDLPSETLSAAARNIMQAARNGFSNLLKAAFFNICSSIVIKSMLLPIRRLYRAGQLQHANLNRACHSTFRISTEPVTPAWYRAAVTQHGESHRACHSSMWNLEAVSSMASSTESCHSSRPSMANLKQSRHSSMANLNRACHSRHGESSKRAGHSSTAVVYKSGSIGGDVGQSGVLLAPAEPEAAVSELMSWAQSRLAPGMTPLDSGSQACRQATVLTRARRFLWPGLPSDRGSASEMSSDPPAHFGGRVHGHLQQQSSAVAVAQALHEQQRVKPDPCHRRTNGTRSGPPGGRRPRLPHAPPATPLWQDGPTNRVPAGHGVVAAPRPPSVSLAQAFHGPAGRLLGRHAPGSTAPRPRGPAGQPACPIVHADCLRAPSATLGDREVSAAGGGGRHGGSSEDCAALDSFPQANWIRFCSMRLTPRQAPSSGEAAAAAQQRRVGTQRGSHLVPAAATAAAAADGRGTPPVGGGGHSASPYRQEILPSDAELMEAAFAARRASPQHAGSLGRACGGTTATPGCGDRLWYSDCGDPAVVTRLCGDPAVVTRLW